MNERSNPERPDLPDLFDVLATAVILAADELARVRPQNNDDPAIDSSKIWQNYLLQEALRKQQNMTDEERSAFREKHYPSG